MTYVDPREAVSGSRVDTVIWNEALVTDIQALFYRLFPVAVQGQSSVVLATYGGDILVRGEEASSRTFTITLNNKVNFTFTTSGEWGYIIYSVPAGANQVTVTGATAANLTIVEVNSSPL